jgi:AcrR family transcriptional regulator
VEAARKPFADASRDLLRDTVLDAVGELASVRPWSDVTMAEVALAAGVSRQTLYNTFGSRQEMAQAYVLREAERFVEAVAGEIRSRPNDPREALRGALEIFLGAAETHPLIKAVAAGDQAGEEFLPLLTTRGGPLVSDVTERLGKLMQETWPGLAAADARLLADCLVRLAISHAALPVGSPSQTAESVARILGPFVDELLAEIRRAQT